MKEYRDVCKTAQSPVGEITYERLEEDGWCKKQEKVRLASLSFFVQTNIGIRLDASIGSKIRPCVLFKTKSGEGRRSTGIEIKTVLKKQRLANLPKNWEPCYQ